LFYFLGKIGAPEKRQFIPANSWNAYREACHKSRTDKKLVFCIHRGEGWVFRSTSVAALCWFESRVYL